MFLSQCKLIADVAVISQDEVLLVKYKDGNKYDHQSGWFLPDDLINEFEHPDDAAKRILHEQLDLTTLNLKISFIESFRGNDKSWHLVFHYVTELPGKLPVTPSSDLNTYNWFNLKDLPDKKEVAHHGWAIFTINKILTNN